MSSLTFDPAVDGYVSLATFRKNGKEVRTAVWIAPGDGVLYVYTNAKSGKVKRIRNGSRARLARCDVRGRVLGEWCDVSARMLDEAADRERGLAAIVAKYGWQMRLALFSSRLSGRHADRACIELKPL
ncbi:MAG: PPOX class F420-dependent oxidoreductase [Myxococcota bacterium]